MAFPDDLEIARGAALEPLKDVAAEMGIPGHLLEPYGGEVVKVKLAAVGELAGRPAAKYVVVSAVTPTPLGEGKTTTTVGLGEGFRHIGRRATVPIRQPSMGRRLGSRAGGGGGYSQVVPMKAVNSLRNIVVGLGGRRDGIPRQSGFDITADSEMATPAASLADLRERLGRIVAGYTRGGAPVTAEQLSAAGSMAVLLRGDMRTMPGPGSSPAATRIDLDADGQIVGLS